MDRGLQIQVERRWRRLVYKALLWARGVSFAASTLLALGKFDNAILPLLSALLAISGVCHLGRAVIHRNDPSYVEAPAMLKLVCADLRFAVIWIAATSMLVVLGLVVDSVVVLSSMGALAALIIYVYGISNAGDTIDLERLLRLLGGSTRVADSERVKRWNRRAQHALALPGTRRFLHLWGRKTPEGQISAYLAKTLSAVACLGFGYVGLAVAEVFKGMTGTTSKDVVVQGTPGAKKSQARKVAAEASPSGKAPVTRSVPPNYADSCPKLPNPLDIGHGLGRLFWREGAVQAGCGEYALRVAPDGSVWMARGVCAEETRSLAVSVEGHGAVLLYGAPARFAWKVGNEGKLRYAETARPGGGNLDIIGTTGGTYVFVRSSSSIHPGSGTAIRCTQVDDVPRPFALLEPALAELWLQHVRLWGWAWPLNYAPAGSQTDVFIDDRSGEVVASGRCDDGGLCSLHGSGESRTLRGSYYVSIADLRPYMPRHVG